MMKKMTREIDGGPVVVLGDIHGNFAALQAVFTMLDNLETPPELIVVNGDIISLGPEPIECLEFCKARDNLVFVKGNNERYVTEELYKKTDQFHRDIFEKVPSLIIDNLAWTHAQLSPRWLEEITHWPNLLQVEWNQSVILIAHASPESDEIAWFPQQFGEGIWPAAHPCDFFINSHIHRSFFAQVGDTIMANTGSLGASLDGNSDASFLSITSCKDQLFLKNHRVEYDVETTVSKLVERQVPMAKGLIMSLRNASLS
jgi:predicted phosphodiesterase